ncbi:MAG: hypothetical protein ACM3JD_19820 [Rudaea sp.]
MNPDTPPLLLFLLFFSLFHVIGGFVVGRGLRQILFGPRGAQLGFLFVWGLMFGGLPLCIGGPIFVLSGAPQVFAAEVAIVIAATFAGAILKDEYLEAFTTPAVAGALFGGVFLLVGIALVTWGLPRGIGEAATLGLLFTAAGLAVVVASLVSQLRQISSR